MTASSFGSYVAAQQQALVRLAMVLCGDKHTAEDIVSDVLARAYERWDRIQPLAQPHAYVRRMVVNQYLSSRRGWARLSTHADMSGFLAAESDSAQQHGERDAMLTRLAALPAKQRAVVVLRFYEGLSDADIAAELSCSPATVRSQLSRALSKLRISLADASPEPLSTKEI